MQRSLRELVEANVLKVTAIVRGANGLQSDAARRGLGDRGGKRIARTDVRGYGRGVSDSRRRQLQSTTGVHAFGLQISGQPERPNAG